MRWVILGVVGTLCLAGVVHESGGSAKPSESNLPAAAMAAASSPTVPGLQD